MPTSVMPKGVEHINIQASGGALDVVPTSVMPKGVEHLIGTITADTNAGGADLCDAERR